MPLNCPPPPVLTPEQLRSARALVVGMERSGTAAAELLVRHGAEVMATDLRPLDALAGAAEVLNRLGVSFQVQSIEVFTGRDLIVVSPGVPCGIEPLRRARERGVPVIGDVELASYFQKGETIGITGSNGKTTTTALVGHILRESGIPVQVGGNIGAAVTGMVETSRPGQWNVLELSSFQLETIAHFRSRIGICLNVTPDHLDRHHTFEIYAAAKRRLFETQQPGDVAVLNEDDAVCHDFAAHTRAEVVWFSVRRGLCGGNLMLEGEPLLPASELPIRGMHNVENTLAAAAAAQRAGVPRAMIAAAIRTFRAVEHRLEFVRTAGGIHFYNDSKATNVDATLKALDAFPGGLWVILGGKDKGSDYRVLRESLAAKANGVLLIGAAAAKIREQVQGTAPVYDSGTLAAAVQDAYSRAVPGDTVLLAPACASFDQFTSYEHRGHVFKDIVRSLEEKE
jgi:UDP-N-acetylmuramoylalanine--D-glutamate ligase